jgi:hypothetical protein
MRASLATFSEQNGCKPHGVEPEPLREEPYLTLFHLQAPYLALTCARACWRPSGDIMIKCSTSLADHEEGSSNVRNG